MLPTQKSTSNGPFLALTASTRLNSAVKLPDGSPANKTLTGLPPLLSAAAMVLAAGSMVMMMKNISRHAH